ncbi:hypothetical protein G7054_g1974 [Neopestalotiopsis clavispora]|nr:hypothetical protein G7054_g1974 [Neopestalotiopsis clavispora]
MNFDIIPKKAVGPPTWNDEEIGCVSGFYGPGAILAWLITSLSMLYDANQSPQASPDPFDWLKYGTTILTCTWALCDAVWRARNSDFGPSYAAALYMSDKGFELGTLLYTVRFFPIHRTRNRPSAGADEERAEQATSLSSQIAASVLKYTLWPCVIMVSIWVWCRALSNGHNVYIIPAQNPESPMFQWEPLLPSWCKLILAILSFVLTAIINRLMNWDWWGWGLPAGILSSFAALHSGLFGTYAPLKLTTGNITESDQIFALVSTLLLLFVQYGRESALVIRTGERLKRLFTQNRARPNGAGHN